MPQIEGGGTGGDPNQAQQLWRALRQAGYNVTIGWVENQMENGLTAQQIAQRAQQQFGGGGGGGNPGALNDFLDGLSGSGGSSGSGSSGGSGGSGGSGPTGPDRGMLRANYVEVLRRWGLAPAVGGLGNLVEHAITAEWSTTEFMQAVRKTKAYKERFVGIRWREGMTEGQYNVLYGRYREAAGDVGRGLSRAQFGILLQKGVDASEWGLRVQAIDRIKRNRALFNEFEQVLAARGLLRNAAGKNRQLTMSELYNFVIKRGDPQWERIWEESVVRTGIESAGLKIGKRGDFTRKELLRLINQIDSPRTEVENLGIQDFQKLASTIQEVFPLSKLYGMGVTKKDLAVLSLGGKGADKIAARVDEILATRNLSNEGQAQAPILQKQGGGTSLAYGGLSGEEGE